MLSKNQHSYCSICYYKSGKTDGKLTRRIDECIENGYLADILIEERASVIEINDYESKILDIYARMTEPQLRTIYAPDEGLFIAESPMVIERALNSGYIPESVLTCREALKGHGCKIIQDIKAKYPDAPVYIGSDEVLVRIRGYQLTRGVLCAMRRRKCAPVENILKTSDRVVLLYDVENPSNVGAIFRSAAAMFMDAILLTHDCADPLYRRAARVSVGTVFQIPWTYIPNQTDAASIEDCMELFGYYGFKTMAMALTDTSIPISDIRMDNEEKLMIIVGNEFYGLPVHLLDKCDYIARIPMAPEVDSLNVAAAGAVAFYVLKNK